MNIRVGDDVDAAMPFEVFPVMDFFETEEKSQAAPDPGLFLGFLMAFLAKFLGIPRDMPFLINTKNEYIVHTTQWRGISNNNPNVPASSLSRASCYVGTLLRNTSGGVPRIQRAFRPKSRSRLPLFFGGGAGRMALSPVVRIRKRRKIETR